MASLLRLSENLVNRAVGAYDKLFALEPRDQSEIYVQMGRELAQRGNLNEALEALRKASELFPRDVEALIEIGVVHLMRQAPLAAVQALEQAKSLGTPGYRLHKTLADALFALEKYEEALPELESALRLQPGVPEHYYQLGTTLDRLGRFEEAVKAFEVAIQLGPNEVAYHQSLGFTLESMGRRSQAIKCFKRALELERTPTNGLSFARK
jgi:tetratricopeptide (TPR) repeat protein